MNSIKIEYILKLLLKLTIALLIINAFFQLYIVINHYYGYRSNIVFLNEIFVVIAIDSYLYLIIILAILLFIKLLRQIYKRNVKKVFFHGALFILLPNILFPVFSLTSSLFIPFFSRS